MAEVRGRSTQAGLVTKGPHASLGFSWQSRAQESQSLFRKIRDQDMSISSELGSVTLPWTRFIDVWETPEFWMKGQLFYSF